MKKPVIIIGVGQLGGVFARGFLRAGRPVYPVVRGMDMDAVSKTAPAPALVLLAAPENVFHDVIKRVPSVWRGGMVFLQNELLPRDWLEEDIPDPTVMPVWFEKKKGTGVHVFQPTPVYGPNADRIAEALHALGIPCAVLSDKQELLFELVKKNLYVLTINIVGLEVGGTAGQLWSRHEDLTRRVANELLDIQEWLTGETFHRDEMIASIVDAFGKAPDHTCRGRVAEDRLDRTLAHADGAGVAAPVLRRIKKELR